MDNSRDSSSPARPNYEPTPPPSYEEATGTAALARSQQLVAERSEFEAYRHHQSMVASGLARFFPNRLSELGPPPPPSPSSSASSGSSAPSLVSQPPSLSPIRVSVIERLAELDLLASPVRQPPPQPIPSNQATASSTPPRPYPPTVEAGAFIFRTPPRFRATSPRHSSPPPGDANLSEGYIRREQVSRVLFAAVLSVKEQKPLANPDQLWLDFVAKLSSSGFFEDEEDIREAWESVFRDEPRALFYDFVNGDLNSALMHVWAFVLPA